MVADHRRILNERCGIGSLRWAFSHRIQPMPSQRMNRNNALVAVSTGLLRRFDEREVRAVLAHEIGHVANGDMITLSLIQGVVNTFVAVFARIISHTVDRVVFKTARIRYRVLHHHDRRGNRAGDPRQHDRDVVLALPRISRGCRRRAVGG